MVTDLSAVGELMLSVMNCERLIGLRYPFWHRVHVTKSRLIKTAFACFVIGITSSQIRNFTEAGRVSNFLVFSCSWLCTLIFAVLIWWTIKQRNQKAYLESGDAQNSGADQQPQGNVQNHRNSVSWKDDAQASDPHLNVEVSGVSKSDTGHEQANSTNIPLEHDLSSFEDVSKVITPVSTALKAGHKTSLRKSVPQKQNDSTSRVQCDAVNNKQEKQAELQTFNVKIDQKHSEEITGGCHKIESQLTLQAKSNANVKVSKSERKAAKLATYLAISLVPTRLIPIFIFYSLYTKFNMIYVFEPWLPTLTLLISLINPVIYIGANQDIRKTCLRFINCQSENL